MLKKTLLIVAALVVVFLVVVALQPSQFSVQRSATISAPPPVVFDHVNDLAKWRAWSPWEKKDPAMQRTLSGPPAGVGASYAWAGNKDVGKGSMTITDSRPAELIRIRLEFIEPFASTSTTEFTFKPAAENTTVTWAMTGKNNFIGKAACLFMNMDKMVGGDFEQGLAGLNAVAAAPAAK
jgi:uncharacterized protein YndB with AHSA1/START domain